MLQHAKNFLFVLAFLSFLGCNPSKPETPIPVTKKPTQTLTIPNSLSIEGDFDGDGNKEKMVSFVSDSTGKAVNSIPYGEEWSETLDYVFSNGINTKLYIEGRKSDTIKLGTSMGVYCLINLGDINNDKKDEIVFVTDHPDYSSVNTGRIYSLCNGKWSEIKTFGVHEEAFSTENEKKIVFKEIKGFLEQHKGKWLYSDYNDESYTMYPPPEQMKPLTVPFCKK